MGQHFCSVVADKIETTVLCAYPLSVASVNGYGTYRNVGKQIVGIVCAIVARHFYLSNLRTLAPTVGVGDNEEARSGAYPNASVDVLHHGVDTSI